jgi:hypothetical protein
MAHRPKVEHLEDKHWKALELIDSGARNMAEVARTCGMDERDFHHLLSGNVEKMGNRASVFQKEYMKVLDKKINQKEKLVAELLQSSQATALEVLERQLNVYKAKKSLDKDDQKMLTYLTKALAALKPSGPKSMKLSQTWNYTKGLTPQELAHEYSRLKGLSQGPPDRGGVSEPEQAGPGVLRSPSE